eukprot:scaffold1884_cov343-Ochromonas_danica.AAC.23
MEERLNDPRLLLGTSEFRGAVEGALKADSEGRDLGVVGHPSHLNKEETQEFLEECQREADNGVPVTYKVAANIANRIQKVHRQQHLETYHEITPGVARAIFKAHGIRVEVPRLMEKNQLLEVEAIPEAVQGKGEQAFGEGRIAFQSRTVSPALGEEQENFEHGSTNKKKRKQNKSGLRVKSNPVMVQ